MVFSCVLWVPYYFALENNYLLLKLTTLTPTPRLHDSKFFWPVVYDVLLDKHLCKTMFQGEPVTIGICNYVAIYGSTSVLHFVPYIMGII